MEQAFIQGNTSGVSKHILQQFESWSDYVLPKTAIIDEELAAFMIGMTAKLGQEIAVYINRQGRVINFSIGDSGTVQLPPILERRSDNQLSGLRCIHTHPTGYGQLSDLDVSAAFLMRLDCMVALGAATAGPNTAGLVWGGPLKMEELQAINFRSLKSVLEINFWARIQELEKNRRLASFSEEIDQEEKGILIALSGGRAEAEVESSLKELLSLAKTAQVKVLETIVQNKDKPSAATYVHSGKAIELAHLAQTSGADVLIIDDEISHSQMSRLADIVGVKVIDRSMLILDIFARRAHSNEGKLQVELAQMHYTLPRIMGQGKQLSRLAGGIGTRGPGESKLETDRRRIRARIRDLENSLAQVRRTRDLHRQQRKLQALPVVALVGYTNAGKSTLLNAITAEDTFAEDILFATLDTVTRRVTSPYGSDFLLSDTVGFIRRLPHHLIAAFRATLEEVTEADILLHVIDASAADWQEQSDAVLKVLGELDALAKPTIAVINKTDLVEHEGQIQRLLSAYPSSVAISAKQQKGLDSLLQEINRQLPQSMREMRLLLPHSAGAIVSGLYQEGQVLHEEYVEEGIKLHVKAPEKYWSKLQKLHIEGIENGHTE